MTARFPLERIPALLKVNGIVFISSFCVMVIELVAARILAPYIGVSLYTWTSIIGTILASIALGNYIGGKIGDKYTSHLVLVAIFLAGALGTIGILPATKAVAAGNWFSNLPIMLNFTLKTCFIFAVPALVLSMVSPLAIKLTLTDLKQTGGIVGTIYAVSTIGAIVGTFMTGFYFILWFGVSMIIWLVAGVLLITGVIVWFSWEVPDRWKFSLKNFTVWLVVIVVILAGVLLFQLRDRWQVAYTKESNYYSIQVIDYPGGKMKELQLDNVHHALVIPDEPTNLQFMYLKAFADIVGYVNVGGLPLRTLHLGGGGYTFPRYLEAVYAGSSNHVVEIDPVVTDVAYEELGLPRDTDIKTYNLDARQFLIQHPGEPKYNLIIGDVFSSLSTPYHLTTYEFDKLVKNSMEPDGVYLVNIIDDYVQGRYTASIIRTLLHTFNNVYLFSMQSNWNYAGLSNYVIAATDRDIDLNGLKKYSTNNGGFVANAHDPIGLMEYLTEKRAILMTDDHVPTDILLAGTIN